MSLNVGSPQNWEELEQFHSSIQTWVGKQEGLNDALESQQAGLQGAIAVAVPTGSMFQWPTATAPSGYLLCDGAGVDRTVYANLYAIIGTLYGAGNGSTTFNVPDLRGRFALGKAASGTGSTLAGTGGSIDHTHTGPSHTHTLSGSTASDGSHTHTFTTNGEAGGANVAFGADFSAATSNHTHNGTTDSGGAHTHGVGTLVTAAGGTGATGSANPPFLAINYIIRT